MTIHAAETLTSLLTERKFEGNIHFPFFNLWTQALMFWVKSDKMQEQHRSISIWWKVERAGETTQGYSPHTLEPPLHLAPEQEPHSQKLTDRARPHHTKEKLRNLESFLLGGIDVNRGATMTSCHHEWYQSLFSCAATLTFTPLFLWIFQSANHISIDVIYMWTFHMDVFIHIFFLNYSLHKEILLYSRYKYL